MDSHLAVPEMDSSDRRLFLLRVYGNLIGALSAFVAIEVWLFRSGLAEPLARTMMSVSWLLILGAFILLSWLASLLTTPSSPRPVQYAGFLFFVALESALFVPLLYLADSYAPGVIASAAQATLGGFLLMTAIVVSTRKDFSFLRVFLLWGGTFSLIAIVLSLLIGFQLGTWFSVGMILLAGGSVLYTTSSILREHEGDGDIAAAQQLFASIALMFWYVLQLFLSSRR